MEEKKPRPVGCCTTRSHLTAAATLGLDHRNIARFCDLKRRIVRTAVDDQHGGIDVCGDQELVQHHAQRSCGVERRDDHREAFHGCHPSVFTKSTYRACLRFVCSFIVLFT